MIRLKLKEVLQEKKISQSKLSRMADVSLNTIQAIYHNPYHDAVLSTLDRLAKALGVNVCDLYEVVSDDDPSVSSQESVACMLSSSARSLPGDDPSASSQASF